MNFAPDRLELHRLEQRDDLESKDLRVRHLVDAARQLFGVLARALGRFVLGDDLRHGPAVRGRGDLHAHPFDAPGDLEGDTDEGPPGRDHEGGHGFVALRIGKLEPRAEGERVFLGARRRHHDDLWCGQHDHALGAVRLHARGGHARVEPLPVAFDQGIHGGAQLVVGDVHAQHGDDLGRFPKLRPRDQDPIDVLDRIEPRGPEEIFPLVHRAEQRPDAVTEGVIADAIGEHHQPHVGVRIHDLAGHARQGHGIADARTRVRWPRVEAGCTGVGPRLGRGLRRRIVGVAQLVEGIFLDWLGRRWLRRRRLRRRRRGRARPIVGDQIHRDGRDGIGGRRFFAGRLREQPGQPQKRDDRGERHVQQYRDGDHAKEAASGRVPLPTPLRLGRHTPQDSLQRFDERSAVFTPGTGLAFQSDRTAPHKVAGQEDNGY